MSAGPDLAGVLVALGLLPGVGPAALDACRRLGAHQVWAAVREGPDAVLEWPEARAVLGAGAATSDDQRALVAACCRAAELLEPEAILERHASAGITVRARGSHGYPARLAHDDHAPAVVFSRGELGVLDGPQVAIVGTRNATRVGCETARSLASELVVCGVSVVSGLALGIDGAAHRGALDAVGPGRTVGVVACGLDRSYPRRHDTLHRQVAERGLLLGEAPLGCPPERWRFPARNRIIATLADAVVVVESRSTGGSMLTAVEAGGRGRPLLAVPGHPTSAAAAGPLDLICDGAHPVRDVEDVLVAIGLGGASLATRGTGRAAEPGVLLPDGPARQVLDVLEGGPRTLDEVLAATGLALDRASAALLELEAVGAVVRSGGWFESATRRGLGRGTGR